MDQSTFVIRDVRIFDGAQVLPVGSVLVREGIIAEVGTTIVPPDGCPVIEGRDRTLLPGLIDAHVHLPSYPPFAPRALRQSLAFGVTTQLDMNTDPSSFPTLRTLAAQNDDVSDFRSAGWAATAPGGHPTQFWEAFPTLTQAEEADAWVADRIGEGSDYIKIIIEDGSLFGESYPRLSPDIVGALTVAAHRQGKMAIAHVTVGATAAEALTAGVDALAHLFVDPPPDAEDAAAMRAAGAFVIPTIGIVERASADLLLVRGDPTTTITATREIVTVWRRGRRFDREAYRAALPAVGT